MTKPVVIGGREAVVVEFKGSFVILDTATYHAGSQTIQPTRWQSVFQISPIEFSTREAAERFLAEQAGKEAGGGSSELMPLIGRLAVSIGQCNGFLSGIETHGSLSLRVRHAAKEFREHLERSWSALKSHVDEKQPPSPAAVVEAKWIEAGLIDEGDYWWHWNGDEDSAPVPVWLNASWIGSPGFNGCEYFAAPNQLGWTYPQKVTDMGGLWCKCIAPDVPDVR